MLTVVLLSTPKQRLPAAAWAQSLPFHVHLVETWASLAPVIPLLSSLMAQHRQSIGCELSHRPGVLQGHGEVLLPAQKSPESVRDSNIILLDQRLLLDAAASAAAPCVDGIMAGEHPWSATDALSEKASQEHCQHVGVGHPLSDATLSPLSDATLSRSDATLSPMALFAETHLPMESDSFQPQESRTSTPPYVRPPPGLAVPALQPTPSRPSPLAADHGTLCRGHR